MRLHPSPFGSQIPSEHRPIALAATDSPYRRHFRGIATADLPRASYLSTDTFGLRNLMEDPRLAQDIVSWQIRTLREILTDHGMTLPIAASVNANPGDCYVPDPNIPEDVFSDLAAQQAELLRGHPLIFETICQVREAVGITRGLRPDQRCDATLAFTLKQDDLGRFVLPSGEDPLEAFEAVRALNPQQRLGLNCFAPDMKALEDLLKRSTESGFRMHLVYPNSAGFGGDIEKEGLPQNGLRLDPRQLVKVCRPFGVRTVGGCCGCTANDLHCMHQNIHSSSINAPTMIPNNP